MEILGAMPVCLLEQPVPSWLPETLGMYTTWSFPVANIQCTKHYSEEISTFAVEWQSISLDEVT
jgi:hypothetical protein